MLKLFEREQLNLAKLPEAQTAIEVRDLCLRFGDKHVLHNITMRIPKNRITALIGQSGCGKSTLISCFNRMNDLMDNCATEGEIIIDGRNINRKKENLSILRSQVGMVFQRPNPFPMSIYDNVCYGLRLQGIKQLCAGSALITGAGARLLHRYRHYEQLESYVLRLLPAPEKIRPGYSSKCPKSEYAQLPGYFYRQPPAARVH